jgi:spermidine synthase
METKNHQDMWIRERYLDAVELGFKIEERLFSQSSPFQRVEVVKSSIHGGILLNDGIVMLTERDEFVYHEMIAHVPLFVHPAAGRVLVIGGGDGGTVREVLKHHSVDRVVMVEIDEVVVKACREHLVSVSCALDDPRLEIIIADGIKFAAETADRFDIVIVDSTDPLGPGLGLFQKPFYENIAKILSADGILITQAETPFYDLEMQQSIFSNQRPFFKRLHMYLYTTLAYAGGLYSFGFASKGPCPLRDFKPEQVENSGIATRYYNPGIHQAAFMLPNFIREKLGKILDPLPCRPMPL